MPTTLRRFLEQSAIWTLLCGASALVCYKLLHLRYPYDYPAMPRQSMFGDFRYWTAEFAHFHSGAFFNSGHRMMYPAAVAVSYRFFLLAGGLAHPRFAMWRFLATMVAASWVMLFCLFQAMVRRGLSRASAAFFLAGVYFLSFPFWFEIHQGNMEFVVWASLAVGLWAFWTERPWLAAALFGFAISLKIFPFVFLGLFLKRKQYREIAFGLLVSGVTTILCLWLVCPNVRYSFQQTSLGLDQFREVYMLHVLPAESGFDHSLFCLIKRLIPAWRRPEIVSRLLTGYLATAALVGTVIFFVRIRKLPVVNRVLCLSVAAILLPPVSYDYTLLHLYAPFFLVVFFAMEQHQRPRPQLKIILGLFAFLLSAQEEWIYHGLRYAGQLKAIALLGLFIAGLIYPLPTAADDDKPGRQGLQKAAT